MLQEILEYKKEEVAKKQKEISINTIISNSKVARTTRDFLGAMKKDGISLMAEVKYKSPSKGVLRQGFEHLDIAKIYAQNGARAISVLADENFFGGSSSIVKSIANDENIAIPVMFKEFVISPYQVYEARACGADAILLIVRAVEYSQLKELLYIAKGLGMEALVEVFLPEEAEIALKAGASIVGINNRDLKTFKVNIKQSEEIMKSLPDNIVTVSESGLNSREDALKMEKMGFDGMLVGEAIVTASDIGMKVREFMGLC